MEICTLVRNPYPLPELSREARFLADGPLLDKHVDPTDRRWYTKVEPHQRLFSHHTLNSTRKDCRYRPKWVPKDSLDLALSSVYSHDSDSWVPKCYTLLQPENVNEETWRVLRNQIKVYTKPPLPLGHEIKYAVHATGSRKKVHPSSLTLATEGPHTDRTNPGYSRKIDGTYYGI